MLFFSQLEKIGISREDIKSINGENIIRIEKRLLAESRLDGSIPKNDIYTIIEILNHYPEQIELIAQDDGLYNILANKRHTYYMHWDLIFRPEHRDKIYKLVNTYFTDSVVSFINTSIKNDSWYGLNILLQYKEFISPHMYQVLINRIDAKIEQAFAILQLRPSHRKLNQKLRYLIQEDFYTVLGLTDAPYFTKDINKLIAFIKNSDIYTDGRTYFDKMLHAMLAFKPNDQAFKAQILSVILKYGGRKKNVVYTVVTIIVVVCSLVYLVMPKVPDKKQNKFQPRTNYWESQKTNGVLEKIHYERMDLENNWLNFLEAREDMVDADPVGHLQTYRPEKYVNPFRLWIFSRYNDSIMNGNKKMYFFNDTYKECVLVLVNQQKADLPKYHAVYVPPNDSIAINYDNYRIRIYTGRNLKSFNNYKEYVYKDSLDIKFSKVDNVDATLINHEFYIADTLYNKPKTLRLSVPTPMAFDVSWDGENMKNSSRGDASKSRYSGKSYMIFESRNY